MTISFNRLISQSLKTGVGPPDFDFRVRLCFFLALPSLLRDLTRYTVVILLSHCCYTVVTLSCAPLLLSRSPLATRDLTRSIYMSAVCCLLSLSAVCCLLFAGCVCCLLFSPRYCGTWRSLRSAFVCLSAVCCLLMCISLLFAVCFLLYASCLGVSWG
jgi:hypothetical protein